MYCYSLYRVLEDTFLLWRAKATVPYRISRIYANFARFCRGISSTVAVKRFNLHGQLRTVFLLL